MGGEKASFMDATTVLRCLKFSINCAAALRLLRILCGTLAFAVSLVTSTLPVTGSGEGASPRSSTPGPR